ncbi:MAG: polymer-forming cytoskeletal protein [Aureispira sp.]|nr:polymer-forming cytoskeletal protein [Aureispira sp.]
MFRKTEQESNKVEKSGKSQLPPNSKEVCNIAAGTVIEGTVKVTSHIRLEGKIIGDVTCDGRLVMSKNASIIGNIKCNSLLTEGTIEGNISAKTDVRLHSTASIKGNIKCTHIHIDHGASFNGNCSTADRNA